jgi:hypothetical protein
VGAPKFFYVVASESGRYLAGITLDIEVTMFELKTRPRDVGRGFEMFDRLVLLEEHPSALAAEARLAEWSKLSGRKKRKLVLSKNRPHADQSATWFPVFAAPGTASIDDLPGDARGGIAARLPQNWPPRSDSCQVDPLDVMSIEDQVECGAYKKLAVGAGA